MDNKEQELRFRSCDSAISPADVLREVANFCDHLKNGDVADIVFSQWMYIDEDDSMSVRWGATVYYFVDKESE